MKLLKLFSLILFINLNIDAVYAGPTLPPPVGNPPKALPIDAELPWLFGCGILLGVFFMYKTKAEKN
ncbi:hypothetical protein [Flavobacterium algicola]|uniref:hypothetical protein n=1 Tax=Flavobacterium algicola TaxID=556529 RepID=UPI001EFCD797|nr:hypothetical protein [Flavobacterium algicola]MCG9793543.1 hypothetical protein [Flavobacterium algicola]